MKNKYQFQLIDGEFTPVGAAKVLFPLLNNKINYHSLEHFSNEIRFNKKDAFSQKRIEELQQVQLWIQDLLEKAEENGLQLKITSQINIELHSIK
ncbi:hypothetical protein [Flavobacterium sp. TSSA_36]|jgi:histidinol phosphatase-like PHP family hydrolase|uniref:hypothetical protein n=1 Tax=Flavobacterium sp. TSSA_36 TaxID=3447669 RepID=UPI003F3E77BA